MAEIRRHKKEEYRGKKGLSCDKCEKHFPHFPPGWWPTRERFTTACSLSTGVRKILLTFSRTMKVAHFEDKPGRHEREERKAYIAAALMANPEYLDSLAPKPFTKEDIRRVISIILLVYL